MGDEHPQVDFLEPEDGQGSVEDVQWLDEEGLASQHSGSLPPRTTLHRVAVSLLVFALGLSLTGFSGLAAYRHDQAVAARANELVLREVDVGDAVTLTDPGQLGGTNAWRIEPTAAIAVGVTNESPDAITLLPGATLNGPGLTGPSTLSPIGATVLAPGQSGRLTGTVTVQCGLQQAGAATGLKVRDNTVLVQARTASGAVGVALLSVGQGADAVRQQICTDEGDSLAASFFPVSVDEGAHSFTVAVSAHSLSAEPLKYWTYASFTDTPAGVLGGQSSTMVMSLPGGRPVIEGLSVNAVDALLPGARLTDPQPVGPVDGTLAVGANTTAEFTVHVAACPTSPPTGTADLALQMFLDDNGQPAYFQEDSFELGPLVATACGLIA